MPRIHYTATVPANAGVRIVNEDGSLYDGPLFVNETGSVKALADFTSITGEISLWFEGRFAVQVVVTTLGRRTYILDALVSLGDAEVSDPGPEPELPPDPITVERLRALAAEALKADLVDGKVPLSQISITAADLGAETLGGSQVRATAARDEAVLIASGDAASKVAVEEARALAAEASKVTKSGDTMTGPLILAADPTNALGAATKQYVLDQVAALVGSAPGELNDFMEVFQRFTTDEGVLSALTGVVAGKQPLDDDLTAIAGLVTTSLGRSLLTIADAAAGRSILSAASQASLTAHVSDTSNPHGTTKAQVGLGLVDNVSAASLRDRSTHTGNQPATSITGLAPVATSGSYADLSNKPAIPSIAGLATTGDVVAASTLDRDRANHTGVQSSASISDFAEAAQDAVAALLTQGAGVTLAYNDAGNTLTVSSTGSGGITDPEVVRDTIGAALVGVGNIGVALNDAADTITITTTATMNSTDAALRDRSTHTGQQSLDTTTDSATRLALLPAERTKLAGVATSATANATDAQLRDRSTHTGPENVSTTTLPQMTITNPNQYNVSQIRLGPEAGVSSATVVELFRYVNNIRNNAPTNTEVLTFGMNSYGSNGNDFFVGTDAAGDGTLRPLRFSVGSQVAILMRTDGRAQVTRLSLVKGGTPATPTSTGTAGDVAFDDSYLAIANGANTWKRLRLEDNPATNAELRDRSTHTGSQSLDTTTDSATRLAMTPAERSYLTKVVSRDPLFATTDTSGTDAGKWTRVATSTQITSQYWELNTQIMLLGTGGGNAAGITGRLAVRVKQQNALGGVPVLLLEADELTGISLTDLRLVITQNDATATVAELWIRVPVAYTLVCGWEQASFGSAGWLYKSGQPYQTAAPTGTGLFVAAVAFAGPPVSMDLTTDSATRLALTPSERTRVATMGLVPDASNPGFLVAGPAPVTTSGVLARKSYSPTAKVVLSTTSTAPVDLDATNLAVTFTVPLSGAVVVILDAVRTTGSSTTYTWCLRQGTSVVAGSAGGVGYNIQTADRTSLHTVITGLTPSAVVTWKWAHMLSFGTGNSWIEAGGDPTVSTAGAPGPATMLVIAA